MKNIIILFFCIVLHQVASTQIASNNETVPRIFTLPGLTNPAFPYADPEEVGLSQKKIEQLGDEVAIWAANGELVGGELLIVKDGKTILHEAYGWSDREKNIPLKRNSIWSIKSMSKPFTATAIMMLSDQGKLSVNDKLTDYIPEYVGDPRTSISDLLSHTSGYSGLGNTWDYKDLGSWAKYMATLNPKEEYGTYHYADFNFAVLGYIVELVSEMPVEEYLQINIIDPLELNNSFTNFSPDSTWASSVNSRYRISGNRFEKFWTNSDPINYDFYPAAWGIWGTAMDYSKFLAMLLHEGTFNDHKFLTEHAVQDMTSPHSFSGGEVDYGYGLYVKLNEKNVSIPLWFGHGGFDGTISFAYPEENLIVILMTHSRGTKTRNALRDRLKMFGFIDVAPDPGMLRGKDFTRPVLPLTIEEVKSYYGYYRGAAPNDPGKEILIRVEQADDHLRAKLNSFGSETGRIRDLIYLGQDRFLPGRYDEGQIAWIDPETEFSFIRKNGTIVSLEMIYKGSVISTEKVDEKEVDMELNALRNITYIDDLLAKAIDEEGIDSARKLSSKLHASRPDSVSFANSYLNSLGYRYLNRMEYEKAIAVFEMNVDAYKDEPNCYDSLGDAWQRKGDLKKAMKNYQKAVNLAREQGDSRLKNIEYRLNAIVDQIEKKGKH